MSGACCTVSLHSLCVSFCLFFSSVFFSLFFFLLLFLVEYSFWEALQLPIPPKADANPCQGSFPGGALLHGCCIYSSPVLPGEPLTAHDCLALCRCSSATCYPSHCHVVRDCFFTGMPAYSQVTTISGSCSTLHHPWACLVVDGDLTEGPAGVYRNLALQIQRVHFCVLQC